MRKVLACSNRDGDTVDGKLVDNFAPDVVMAKFISGTASSMRSKSLLISLIMSLICASFWDLSVGDLPPLRISSSDAAAVASR